MPVAFKKFFSYFSERFNNSRMRIRMYAFRVDNEVAGKISFTFSMSMKSGVYVESGIV